MNIYRTKEKNNNNELMQQTELKSSKQNRIIKSKLRWKGVM